MRKKRRARMLDRNPEVESRVQSAGVRVGVAGSSHEETGRVKRADPGFTMTQTGTMDQRELRVC
jgi:hypothetical protein